MTPVISSGKGRILTLLKFLDDLKCQGAVTNMARTIRAFVNRGQRRGLAIIVSDLYDPEGFQPGLDILRHHRYEPHLVQIYDRKEAEPNLLGDLELFDVESGRVQKMTVTERNLRQYRQVFGRFQESVQNYCNTYGLGCTRTLSDVPFDELVLRMMRTAGAVQ